MATILPSPINPTGRSDDDAEEAAIRDAKQILQELDPLLEDKRFKAVWAEIGAKVTAHRKIALDPDRKKKERNRAVHVAAALKEVYEAPMRKHAAAIERLQQANIRIERAEVPTPSPL